MTDRHPTLHSPIVQLIINDGVPIATAWLLEETLQKMAAHVHTELIKLLQAQNETV